MIDTVKEEVGISGKLWKTEENKIACNQYYNV